MSRLDGKFIKPGSIPQDRLDPEIPLGGDIPPGTVTPEMLGAALLARLVVVTWGDPVAVEPGKQTLPLQLADLNGDPVAAEHVLRLTCDEKATLAVGAHGTALSGDGTSDLIARTDADGVLELTVSCKEAIAVSVAAGPTQASPLLDCRAAAEVSFNP
jgi:hypothetical protein